jgi:hypothetical protein
MMFRLVKRPDDITMPVAQFWEKAVCSTPPTLYLASGEYFERWI